MTLSAVSLPYYRYIMPYGLGKFCRFAVNVWEVGTDGKSDEQIAEEGLSCMESRMKELGLVMNLGELGATARIRKVYFSLHGAVGVCYKMLMCHSHGTPLSWMCRTVFD